MNCQSVKFTNLAAIMSRLHGWMRLPKSRGEFTLLGGSHSREEMPIYGHFDLFVRREVSILAPYLELQKLSCKRMNKLMEDQRHNWQPCTCHIFSSPLFSFYMASTWNFGLKLARAQWRSNQWMDIFVKKPIRFERTIREPFGHFWAFRYPCGLSRTLLDLWWNLEFPTTIGDHCGLSCTLVISQRTLWTP